MSDVAAMAGHRLVRRDDAALARLLGVDKARTLLAFAAAGVALAALLV